MRHRRNYRNKNILIGILLVIVVLMAIGYAAFSSTLKISGTSNISTSWNIAIMDITTSNKIGSASVSGTPSYDRLTATFNTDLVLPGDSITYNIKVENKGNLDAKLDKITLDKTDNPAILFDTTGLKEGDTLKQGAYSILSVKVTYNSSVTSQPTKLDASFTVTLDFVQNTSSTSKEDLTPTFTSSSTDSSYITINFPEGCGTKLQCRFSKESSDYINVYNSKATVYNNGKITAEVVNGDDTITNQCWNGLASTSAPIRAYGYKIIAYGNETIDWKEYGGFSYEVLNKFPIDLNEELQNMFYSVDNYGSTLADYFYSEDDFEKFISIRDEFSSYDVFPLSLAANDTAERTEEGKYIIRLTVPQISRKYNNYIILEDTPSNGISVSNVNETDIDLEKKTITFESESMSILYIFLKKTNTKRTI